MATKSPGSRAAAGASDEEIKRLRAQVRELRAELSRYRKEEKEEDDDAGDVRRSATRDSGEHRSRTDRESGDLIDDTSDIGRDLPRRFADEASKFIRGLTFAHLEHLRVAADAVTSFADEVGQRNRPERGEQERGSRRTMTGLASDLPRDIHSGFLRAMDRALDAPSEAVDRFHSSYRETAEEAEPTSRRSRDSDREGTRSDRGHEGEPHSHESAAEERHDRVQVTAERSGTGPERETS